MTGPGAVAVTADGQSPRFRAALELVLDVEKGFANHAWDNGGKTKFGISARSYPELDIENLTREQAAAIYWRDFWQVAPCAELPWEIGYPLFDAAVHHGPGRAVKLLQSAIGATADGEWGPKSAAVFARRSNNLVELLEDFLSWRGVFMAGLEDFDKAGRGWLKRLLAVERGALRFGNGS